MDIVFANEQEILSLIDGKKFDDVYNFSKELKKYVIILEVKKELSQLKMMKLLNVMQKKFKY